METVVHDPRTVTSDHATAKWILRMSRAEDLIDDEGRILCFRSRIPMRMESATFTVRLSSQSRGDNDLTDDNVTISLGLDSTEAL